MHNFTCVANSSVASSCSNVFESQGGGHRTTTTTTTTTRYLTYNTRRLFAIAIASRHTARSATIAKHRIDADRRRGSNKHFCCVNCTNARHVASLHHTNRECALRSFFVARTTHRSVRLLQYTTTASSDRDTYVTAYGLLRDQASAYARRSHILNNTYNIIQA